jgi:hypothetical protein
MREQALRTADQGLIALLAMFAGIAMVGVAYWLAHAADHPRSPGPTEALAFERMRDLAGPGAIDCGRVSSSVDPANGVSCVEAALRKGAAFRVAREGSIFENGPMWFGFTRNARGQQYLVTFATRNAFGRDAPRIDVWPCPSLRLQMADGSPGPRCDQGRYSRPTCWDQPGPVRTPNRTKPPPDRFCWP